jgi:hypothetical protein
MTFKLQVYTADKSVPQAPHEALGRYFFPLGSKHNYGSCYELVCWLKEPSQSNTVDSPYIGLIYNFEMKMCIPCGNIDIKDAITQLKTAIKLFPSTVTNHSLHRDYMVVSAKVCLDQLLLEYSWWMFQVHKAQKIKDEWLWHYWTPISPICQRIRLRQFEELNQELTEKRRKND